MRTTVTRYADIRAAPICHHVIEFCLPSTKKVETACERIPNDKQPFYRVTNGRTVRKVSEQTSRNAVDLSYLMQ
jgi:hypothetical protein